MQKKGGCGGRRQSIFFYSCANWLVLQAFFCIFLYVFALFVYTFAPIFVCDNFHIQIWVHAILLAFYNSDVQNILSIFTNYV